MKVTEFGGTELVAWADSLAAISAAGERVELHVGPQAWELRCPAAPEVGVLLMPWLDERGKPIT